MGKILLFYKYIQISDLNAILQWQRELCESLELKGRIIIAKEGINATLGGLEKSINDYKNAMNNHPLFGEIDFKESPGDSKFFPRLRVVIKNEIVHLGLDTEKYTTKNGGKHLTPEEVHKLIQTNPEDLVLLDTRNDYESKIGTFKEAIVPNTKTFREFPEYVDNNQDKFKNKKIVMFCTGGVRCERASAYLNSKKVAKEVFQIKGGIHRYMEKYPDGYFRGKNYVFDGRISVKANDDILAECELCKIAYDNYTNCINAECNRQIIVCPKCIKAYHNTCSNKCLSLVNSQKVNVRKIEKKVTLEKNQNNV